MFVAAAAWSVVRCVFGGVAFALKVPAWLIAALARGAAPPRFTPMPTLKAAALPELPLQDVELTSADGTKLHAVVDIGNRRVVGKRPIIFAHGYPEGWWSFAAQLEFFIAAGHPVLSLSMRGYGASDKPQDIESYNTFDCLASDVCAAVDYMRGACAAKPLLVGQDWGAGAGWAYVGKGVGVGRWDVAGFVSLSNLPAELFVRNFTGMQAWSSIYIAFFNMPVLPELLFWAGNAWFAALMLNDTRTTPRDPRLLNLCRTDKLQPGAIRAQTNVYRAGVRLGAKPRPEDELSESNRLLLPVLMIRGKEDIFLLGSTMVGWQKLLANAKLVELDRCSHWVSVDKPDETCAAVATFLEELNQSTEAER